MRSRNVFESPRRVTLAVLASSVLASAGLELEAVAQDKQACSDSYDQTQSLRQAGKITEARAKAGECARTCAAVTSSEFAKTATGDCGKWLGELEASQPTVVLVALDSTGHETGAVRVALDNEPWRTSLDGKALEIDPGSHTLHFEMDGAAAIDTTVLVHEGEKNQRIQVAFKASREKDPAPTGEAGPQPNVPTPTARTAEDADSAQPRPTSWWGPVRIAGCVTGGLGIAIAAVGAGVGGSGLQNWLDATDPISEADDYNQMVGGFVTLGVGGAALIAGIVMVAVGQSSPSQAVRASVKVGPWGDARSGGIVLSGSF